jgi:thiF family protein
MYFLIYTSNFAKNKLSVMEERYNRNRLYVSENEQSIIKDYKIFLGGAGIGSIVAECALRLGFEHITIVDGDKVEKTNLNRQNYTGNDIGRYKAECLAERLLSINPNAHITVHTEFLTSDNIEALIANHNVDINALDLKDETPFVFDKIPYFRSVFACKKSKCMIHKSIQTLAYVRKFTYLSATKHIK